jgi:hypothetical protein
VVCVPPYLPVVVLAPRHPLLGHHGEGGGERARRVERAARQGLQVFELQGQASRSQK